MLIQEYIQLVKTLRDDQLIEFTKLFFLCIYKGTDTKIEESDWTNSYVLSIQRDDKTINRFVYISSANDDLSLFIKNNIKEIADNSKDNVVFRKLECFCLSFYDKNSNLVETADIDYNISLVIYDLDAIGNAIESHTDLKSFLLNTSATVSTKHAQFNRKDKILYELFTTGNRIADIKNSFIGSFIQYYLFEKGPLRSDELIALLLDHLPNLSTQTYKEAIRRSKKSGIVEFNNGKYKLTADKRMLIEEMRLVSAATENSLLQQFDMCFSEYGLKDYSHTILNLIIGLYRQQSDNELATLLHMDGSASEKKLVRNLYKTLKNNGIQSDQINNVVSRIMDIISSSEYLNKMSATTLFTGLFNSNSLEDYLGKQKRIVFFDTQILLQLLCVDYSKNVDYINDGSYQDSLYEAGKILYEQIEESRDYVSLYTTPEYIREVSNHLYEAHNLNRFIHLSYIKDLGPSKNIFYNFYLYLSEKGSNKSLDYDDYLADLINSREYLPNNYFDFVRASDSLVKDIFNNFGIVVQQVERPSNLSDIRRIYDNLLGNHPKGNNARENDILCMYYLSDQSNFVNAETGLCEEPYLITLDTTITPMRKKFVEDFKRSFWYIYPPIKFANRLSLMDLKLDSKSINYDVICMAETNFKASYETISMLDIMTMFFKSSEIGDKKLPRLLAQMKAEEKNDDHLREYSEKNNNNLPIDVVLNDIHSYYRKSESFNLENVSQLFEMNDLSEQIAGLLKRGCDDILRTNQLGTQILDELDSLIKQNVLTDSTAN